MRKSRVLTALLGAVAIATLSGCGGPRGMIEAEALQGLMGPVLERHDLYVSRDTDLTPVERETFYRSSELLRGMVREALAE